MSAVAHIDEYKTGKFYSDAFRGDSSWNGYETNVLLRNEGGREENLRFVDVAMALGADDGYDARGVAVLDYDGDGDVDLAINHNPGDCGIPERAAAVLLRNDVGNRRPWLAVDLQGTSSNRDAVGAEVTVEAGGVKLLRQVTAGSSYASQNAHRLHFGLGEAERVERLEVRWPGGATEVFEDLDVRQVLRIVEGEGPPPIPKTARASFSMIPREARVTSPGRLVSIGRHLHPLFADGFESGDPSSWSVASP